MQLLPFGISVDSTERLLRDYYPGNPWVFDELRLYLSRKSLIEKLNGTEIATQAAMALNKGTHRQYAAWVNRIRAELNADVTEKKLTVWDKLKKTKPKQTVWSRLKQGK